MLKSKYIYTNVKVSNLRRWDYGWLLGFPFVCILKMCSNKCVSALQWEGKFSVRTDVFVPLLTRCSLELVNLKTIPPSSVNELISHFEVNYFQNCWSHISSCVLVLSIGREGLSILRYHLTYENKKIYAFL